MSNPAYPTLAIDPKESAPTRRDGRQEDFTGDGAGHVRKLYADRWDFEVKHPALNADDVATLEAFYAANGNVAIDFYWPENGNTYTVRFGANAIRHRWITPTLRDYWVRLIAA